MAAAFVVGTARARDAQGQQIGRYGGPGGSNFNSDNVPYAAVRRHLAAEVGHHGCQSAVPD
jgi:hypothetical protein